ncbi:hypothetical protein PG985_007423 [Apiospora marii]|uniref:uncharacterized protein n=1 Tax=Apiospora marii TaxID=335849 RepID=UPI00312DDEDE
MTGLRQGSPDHVVVGMGLLDRGGADNGNGDSRDLKPDLQPRSEYFCVNRAAWLGEVIIEGGATTYDAAGEDVISYSGCSQGQLQARAARMLDGSMG